MVISMPMKRVLAGWYFLVCVQGLAFPALANGTRSFRQTTSKDFEEGEAVGTSILPPGDVVPGMKTQRLPIDASFAWCGTHMGNRVFFGTGDDGRIVEVGEGKTAKSFAQIGAPWVTALTARGDNQLLAGSTPGARIFTVSTQTGAIAVLVKLPAEHVWALLHDAAKRITFAATGDEGKLFAIDEKGTPKLLWNSGHKHILSLAADGDAILAGTADKALLYRVRRNGHFEVLHDFDADEVRAIVRMPSAIYLAVNDFEKNASEIVVAPGAKTAAGTKVVASAPASGTQPRSDQLKAKSAVYRLDNDGRVEQVFALADGYLTSMLADDQGNLLAASGSQGKIYRLAPDRTVSVIADLPERQALSLVASPTGILVGSGDVGAVYRVIPASGREATYLSKVFDAESPARWGRLWWTGSADLLIETRTGNTGKPDTSWSAFQPLGNPRRHGSESEGEIKAGIARYAQYRVAFPKPDAILSDLSIYCLPHNQRARVTELSLADPGTTPPIGRVHASQLKLRWKVENPDGDELIYRLYYREEGDFVWRQLGGPDPLSKPEFDWNTESIPDGHYVFRIWASDEKATSAARALDFTFVSPPLLVDNAKPEVLDLAIKGMALVGRARDARSLITGIEYAVDGGDYRPIQSDDGILDAREETFTIPLTPSLLDGPHVVNVRVFDQSDNQGAGRIETRRAR